MTAKYQGFPGMEDILPGEIEKWQWIEEKARIFFEASGFKEIRTPLLEPTELFSRSVGESSDIVHKEMFSFKDRGERDMTLRPEMTASVARSVIEKGLLKTTKSLRLYYTGPMFRAERPQAGRKRQFHQIGAEIVNEPAPAADSEAIFLLDGFLKYLGLKKYKFVINDLGSFEEQQKFKEHLKIYFGDKKDKLCPDCQWRLEKNVLRIFDCKVESCRPIIMASTWDQVRNESWEKIRDRMVEHGIPHDINPRLVRGLDYYNGMVFEVRAEGLGAQDAVAGGGRYDRLYEDLGGKGTPCTGFSIGMERLLTALEAQDPKVFEILKTRKVYMAPLEDNLEILRFFREKAVSLREAGARPETSPGVFSLSQHLKKANQSGGRFMVIVGPEELQKGKALVKDLEKREQEEVVIEQVVAHLKKVMNLC